MAVKTKAQGGQRRRGGANALSAMAQAAKGKPKGGTSSKPRDPNAAIIKDSTADLKPDRNGNTTDAQGVVRNRLGSILTPEQVASQEATRADLTRQGAERERLNSLSPADRAGELVNNLPDINNTPVRDVGNQLVNEARQSEMDRLASEQAGQARADEVAGTIQEDKANIVRDIEIERGKLDGQGDEVQAAIEQQKEDVQKIPAEVRSEFAALRDQFDTQVNTALDRTDSARDAALGQVMQGRAAALSAAVNGIQGNINNQVSQIQANQNLTSAQKSSMIAQVRLAGASALAPAVGANVLAFNQLASDTASKFAAVAGQIQTQGLQGQQSLAGQQGQAFAQARTASAQMTDNLISLQSSSAIAFGNSQNQLLATRAQAENSADDLMRVLLPERDTPYADFNGSNSASLQFESEMYDRSVQQTFDTAGFNIQLQLLREMQGTPGSNAVEAALAGLAAGGPIAGLVAGVGSFIGSAFGPKV